MIRNLVGSALALGTLATTASAQLLFTLTGTVVSNGASSAPYAVNDIIQITFSTTATGSSEGYSDSTGNFWGDYQPTDSPIIETLTFTGAVGTYSRPASGSQVGFYAYTNHADAGFPGAGFLLGVLRSDGSVSGLTVGPYELTTISIDGRWPFSVTTGASLPNVNDFFGAYTGAPIAFTNTTGLITLDLPGVGIENDGEVHFTFDSLTITAIPEPSSFAALAGFASLGLVTLRRRRPAA